MAGEQNSKQTQKVQRDRSPAYPFISLRAAFERVVAFEAKFGRHGSPLNMAGLAWGLKGDSSQASQYLSALKYFGLVEYVGPTEDRKVVLTDDARNYMRAQQSTVKAEIAQACALRPKAMQTYWERWGPDRPISEICLDQLILKDGFTESAAKIFLRVYDETIEFAGLIPSGKDEDSSVAIDEAETQLPEVAPVASPSSSAPVARRPDLQTGTHGGVPPKGVGMRQEVFVLAEGDVTIQWPEALSPDSFQDFDDWLAILKRKIKRSVVSPDSQKPSKPVEDQEDDL